jgi:C4-dicarboxylate-specific signal transduction histidine kinase
MQAEEARRQAETELETQRSQSIRSDRLRSLGEMAAGMAHELSQPLAGLRILSEHTLIGLDSGWELPEDKLKERMTTILEQTDRMVNIIQHVRMFAREAGKPDLSDVSVNEAVTSSIEMLGAQFRSRGIQLDVDLTDGLPLVLANQYSLEEVLINLLSNARDAVGDRISGDDTGGCVTVNTNKNGQGLLVRVTDNGVGIPTEILERIFDPSLRPKIPTKEPGWGFQYPNPSWNPLAAPSP